MCKGYPLYLIFELGVQFVQKTVNTADLKADPLKAVQVINCLEFAQWKGQTGDIFPKISSGPTVRTCEF